MSSVFTRALPFAGSDPRAAALPLMMALRPRRVGREGTIASLPLRTAKAFNIQRGSAR
ncbi:hypothetical protein SDC9_190828 [bioreactor metagenome]|uniref:Uncharacterized protein n=1 Tax=bioreactor metagenome TaxID=1076179 RepID=A0A645HYK7_9ZZZZ